MGVCGAGPRQGLVTKGLNQWAKALTPSSSEKMSVKRRLSCCGGGKGGRKGAEGRGGGSFGVAHISSRSAPHDWCPDAAARQTAILNQRRDIRRFLSATEDMTAARGKFKWEEAKVQWVARKGEG